MSSEYDINVDSDTLYEIQYKLKLIFKDLTESADTMEKSLHECGSFLSGAQFNKAVAITENCIKQNRITGSNINHAIKYLEDIQDFLEEYGHYKYNGE